MLIILSSTDFTDSNDFINISDTSDISDLLLILFLDIEIWRVLLILLIYRNYQITVITDSEIPLISWYYGTLVLWFSNLLILVIGLITNFTD